MEWQAPAVVLAARPHGEGGAVVSVLTEAHGRHAGLARGGASRAQAPLWQTGNLVEVRWVARLADQLGALSGELLHPAAALAMDDPLGLALLAAACSVADAALPEREAQPRCFQGLLALVTRLPGGGAALVAEYVAWEAALLADLGYGLDLGRCAVTGGVEELAFVSPRTGRAVSRAAAAPWAGRLLPLPGFLLGQGPPSGPAEWLEGLRLTGHFLGRVLAGGRAGGGAAGSRVGGLPAPRVVLQDRVAALVG